MSTKPQLSERLHFVDVTRGLAILCMLVLHSAHGWVRPESRGGDFWYWITWVGGAAAPLFFLLLGLGLGLQGGAAPCWAAARRVVARGLSLVVLGYLLRAQMWQFDGAAIIDPPQLGAGLVLAGGYLALYVGLQRWGAGGRIGPSLALLLPAAVVTAGGLGLAADVAGPHHANLLRFDVLQGLGLTAALLGPLMAWPVRARRRAAAVLGCTVVGVTPAIRAWVPGPLPPYLAAPLAAWDTPGQSPWAMFPLFPWAAYACFGSVLGSWMAELRDARRGLGRLMLAAGVSGLALACLTSEGLPRVAEALRTDPDLTQAARVGYRLGLGLMVLALAFRTAGPNGRRGHISSNLARLGRASLWIYWVHLEFAFGAPATPLRRQLGPLAWALGLSALVMAMIGLAWGMEHWRKRSRNGPATTGRELAGNLGQRA